MCTYIEYRCFFSGSALAKSYYSNNAPELDELMLLFASHYHRSNPNHIFKELGKNVSHIVQFTLPFY
jgi:hypothetical protein